MFLDLPYLLALPSLLLTINAYPSKPLGAASDLSMWDIPPLTTQGDIIPSSSLDSRSIMDWGDYTAWLWDFVAVLPISTTAPAMVDFYREFSVRASNSASQVNSATNSVTYTSGALRLALSTIDRRPLDWDFVVWWALKQMRAADRGMTGHYIMFVKDKATGLGWLATLEVVGEAVAFLGGGLDGQAPVQVIPGS